MDSGDPKKPKNANILSIECLVKKLQQKIKTVIKSVICKTY